MDWISIISTIASFVGTLSIWEAVKYWLNRKTNKRKEEAEADSAELAVIRETMNFLQEQLKQSEERYANQTERLRKFQDENFTLLREKALLELKLSQQGLDVKFDEGNNHEN